MDEQKDMMCVIAGMCETQGLTHSSASTWAAATPGVALNTDSRALRSWACEIDFRNNHPIFHYTSTHNRVSLFTAAPVKGHAVHKVP